MLCFDLHGHRVILLRDLGFNKIPECAAMKISPLLSDELALWVLLAIRDLCKSYRGKSSLFRYSLACDDEGRKDHRSRPSLLIREAVIFCERVVCLLQITDLAPSTTLFFLHCKHVMVGNG